MAKIDINAPIRSEPEPDLVVYPGDEPQAAWVRPVGDNVPHGAHLVRTIWVGRTPIGVYVKNVHDDREGVTEPVRTYH